MATAAEGQADNPQLIHNIQEINFLEIALILLGTWLAISLIKRMLPFLAERGPSQLRLVLLGAVPVFRLLAIALAIAWILPLVFDVTLQNFLVIAGAASVAVGFAFKDYVSSLIAGIVALVERPYRPGDWVQIGGDYGEVRSVGMRALKICTLHDDIITVPHLNLWTDNISNSNDGARTLMCVVDFFVDPNHDAETVSVALRDVALTSAWLDYANPVNVVVAQTQWGTHYELRAYPFDMRDQGAFKSDMTRRGKSALRDCGAIEVTSIAAADIG